VLVHGDEQARWAWLRAFDIRHGVVAQVRRVKGRSSRPAEPVPFQIAVHGITAHPGQLRASLDTGITVGRAFEYFSGPAQVVC